VLIGERFVGVDFSTWNLQRGNFIVEIPLVWNNRVSFLHVPASRNEEPPAHCQASFAVKKGLLAFLFHICSQSQSQPGVSTTVTGN
jgi:hypothetical protein